MDFLGDKFQMLKWFRKEFPNTISKRTLPMASTGSSPMSACSLFPCTSRITCFCFWMHTCRSWFQMYPAILTIIPAVLWHQTPICFLFAWNFGGASTRTSAGLLECLSSTVVCLSGTWKRCYLLKIPILFSSWLSVATLS